LEIPDWNGKEILNPLTPESNISYQRLLALLIYHIYVLLQEITVLFSFTIKDMLVLKLILYT
jgi:hypothetical protein